MTGVLNSARFRAVFRSLKCRVRFGTDLCILDDWVEEFEEWRRKDVIVLEGVQVSANNSPVFHPSGTVSPLATVTVSDGHETYAVTIAITGRIKVRKL